MTTEHEPVLTTPLTFVMPMREDNPAFADFAQVRERVAMVMGEEYDSPRVTRLCTMLAGNGIDQIFKVELTHATQEDGRWGGVRGVTFWGYEDSPLTLERVMKQKGLGPKTGQLLLDFAINLQYCGPEPTLID